MKHPKKKKFEAAPAKKKTTRTITPMNPSRVSKMASGRTLLRMPKIASHVAKAASMLRPPKRKR
tara:strand:- start:213 stop:404 length:192 start_codon:yes stop_codon:yes gene_type:complete